MRAGDVDHARGAGCLSQSDQEPHRHGDGAAVVALQHGSIFGAE